MMSAKDGKVFLFGRGVYEGDFPYEDVTSTEPLTPGSPACEDYMARLLASDDLSLPNPRIRLDSGKIVWGCECWWGDEAGFDKKYAGAEIVLVDIDAEKAKGEDGVAHGIPDLVRGAS